MTVEDAANQKLPLLPFALSSVSASQAMHFSSSRTYATDHPERSASLERFNNPFRFRKLISAMREHASAKTRAAIARRRVEVLFFDQSLVISANQLRRGS